NGPPRTSADSTPPHTAVTHNTTLPPPPHSTTPYPPPPSPPSRTLLHIPSRLRRCRSHRHRRPRTETTETGGRGEKKGGQDKRRRSNSSGVCDPRGCVIPLYNNHSVRLPWLHEPHQCRSLTERVADQVCECQTRNRVQALRSTHLPFCSSFPTYSLLSCASQPRDEEPAVGAGFCDIDQNVNNTGRTLPETPGCRCPIQDTEHRCRDYLQSLVTLDQLAESRFKGFEDLLSRYDCRTEYSVRWGCEQCK
ncbi:hypothetical protein BaRGS_00026038, partial [Batillaria attramentaria]